MLITFIWNSMGLCNTTLEAKGNRTSHHQVWNISRYTVLLLLHVWELTISHLPYVEDIKLMTGVSEICSGG